MIQSAINSLLSSAGRAYVASQRANKLNNPAAPSAKAPATPEAPKIDAQQEEILNAKEASLNAQEASMNAAKEAKDWGNYLKNPKLSQQDRLDAQTLMKAAKDMSSKQAMIASQKSMLAQRLEIARERGRK